MGFLRVLLTMVTFILLVVHPLAPDDVTSKSVFLEYLDTLIATILPLVYFLPRIDRSLSHEGGERAWEIERAQRLGRGHGGETRVDQEIGSQHEKDAQIYLQASTHSEIFHIPFEYTEAPKNPRPKGWALRSTKKTGRYDQVARKLVDDLIEQYFSNGKKLRPDEAEKRMRERKDILPAQRMTFDQIRNRITTLLSQKKEHQTKVHGNRQRRYKNDFDVTSSGANGCTTSKMNVTIVISTLKNPIWQSFRELTFLSCANHCSIITQTASYTYIANIQTSYLPT
ncbi:hypothetical protein PRIPAC_78525 [Pristionchus pacificus]|uniref:Uncharacterized protein n=1 Tax=Pristionchus pacificus TaxID=54126 RepID=A0A2A6CMU5_PRIPA|nr:hypothetical protein PRIPAC_78525 [Pristionchus pacificus]|eukprot:PDM79522.1 hypothetical protein PRIPAC_32101 [Pristionchus pacificus]